MKKKTKKIVAYITRSWKDKEPPHPLIKILPPFLWELLSYLTGLAILYRIGAYLWDII